MSLKMNLRIVLLCFLILSNFTFCFAGPPPPPSGGSPGCWPPPCIPIDGGISFLIATGLFYGGAKLYSKQKK